MVDFSKLSNETLDAAFTEAQRLYIEIGSEIERRARRRLEAAYGHELKLVGDIWGGLERGPIWPDFKIAWCFYCGERPGWQRDHKIPKSRGGTDAPSNLNRSCQTCNLRKGTMTVEEYRAALERRTGKPHVFFGERSPK